ncbi:MAG: tyrosine-protein phosphatase [Acidobacteria bacterium]|nr:tyrosine-protein phosphatase [Acidobacteriota bacterium]
MKIYSQFRYIFFSVLIITVTLSFSAVTNANGDGKNEDSSKSVSIGTDVGVENFGQVTDFFFRGAQPKGEEYHKLAALGIKTIIDLRNDPKEYARELSERAGMRYINLPLNDKALPSPDAPAKFLELINNRGNWPVYVHCAGGRHRTGAMAAVFRMSVQGWDINRAYQEMKDYDFYTRWGHKPIKQFVFDYYRKLSVSRLINPATPASREIALPTQ